MDILFDFAAVLAVPCCLTIFLVTVVGIGWMIARQRRVSNWSSFAQRTGLSYDPRVDPPVMGKYRGRAVTLGSVQMRNLDEYTEHMCMQVAVNNPDRFRLSLRPKSAAARLVEAAGAEAELQVLDAFINQQFHITSSDPRFAVAVLSDTALRQALERAQWINLGLEGECIAYQRPGIEYHPVRLQAALDTLVACAEAVERVIV